VACVLGSWVVVVPVRDAAAGKTRLAETLDPGARAALVRAMALDTIAAAAACRQVGRVVVVTGDEVVSREALELGARSRGATGSCQFGADVEATEGAGPAGIVPDGTASVVVLPEPSHEGSRSGLDAAAAAGVVAARSEAPEARVGVLLGDVPALRPDDLAAALAAAAGHGRAFVADAAGTGTTLLTVGPDVPFASRFGAGSAAAHAALGFVRLDVPDASTLRHDVDLPADLAALRALRPGPRTARLLDALAAGGWTPASVGADG
jgi:2-phospho-L-lactate guanylyltransferase